jgi:hypothetical protein
MRNKMLWTAVAMALVGSALLLDAVRAPAQPRGGRDGWRHMTPEQRAERMKEFRDRMLDHQRERLGFTKEEWTVVSPRYVKVSELRGRLAMGGRGWMRRMMGRGRPGRGREDERDDERDDEKSPLVKAREALDDLVEQDNADAGKIADALKTYRDERSKVEQQLAKARKELREVLNARQEAMLVLQGMIE